MSILKVRCKIPTALENYWKSDFEKNPARKYPTLLPVTFLFFMAKKKQSVLK
jgi:hypothetical protein